jgi:hypothetical protein
MGPMAKQTRMGRPPKGEETMMAPITIRLPPAMTAEIEAIMAARMDAPDKATVIRELIAAGLSVGPKKTK